MSIYYQIEVKFNSLNPSPLNKTWDSNLLDKSKSNQGSGKDI